jgi:plasmid stabilization system protein ParE
VTSPARAAQKQEHGERARPVRGAACALVASAAMLLVSAAGQSNGLAVGLAHGAAPAPLAQDGAAAQTGTQLSESTQRAIADALWRVALLDLRVRSEPQGDDYAMAGMVMELAQRFAPDDIELLHRRAEAAWGEGDAATLERVTTQIVRADPSDTVAQLRLISSRISRVQTLEARLSMYDQFLGPRGESLDAALRSRLALDSALLLRERGDDRAFLDRLKQAVRLDATNKEAALMALNFYSQRVNDPFGRLELMANLLYADPLDPNVHFMIAGELAGLGAFVEARRFHRIAQRILLSAGTQLEPARMGEAMVLDWMVEGARRPMEFVIGRLEGERNMVLRQRRDLLGEESDGARARLSTLPRPEDVLLTPEYEEVRSTAALSLGDRAALAASMVDMTRYLTGMIEELTAANTRPAGMTESQARAQIDAATLRLCIWRMFTGIEVDLARSDLEGIVDTLEETSEVRRAVKAWEALRTNQPELAYDISQLPGVRTQWVDLAGAEALDRLGRKADSIATFEKTAAENPLTILSAYAYDRAAQVRGGRREPGDLPTADAQRAAAYARTVPAWIDTMADQPRLFQQVSADVGSQSRGALDRATVKLTLRNVSPIPMAMGSNKPINTRFLFNPKLETSMTASAGMAEAEVFDLSRRFRLMPGEQVSFTVWPEGGLVGLLSQQAASAPTRIRWRILQGFETRGGIKDRGVACVEINTNTQARDALLEARIPAESMVERLRQLTPSNAVQLLAGARVLLLAPAREGFVDAGKASIAETLATQYPTWPKEVRLLAVSMMPPSSTAAELRPLDEAIRADTDDDVTMLAIFARAFDASDPLLAKGTQEGASATVTRAADLQRRRIERGGALYARDGISTLTGPAAAAGVR